MVINLFFYQASQTSGAADYLKAMGFAVADFSRDTYDRAILALESEFFDLCIVDLSTDVDNRFSLVDKAREMDSTVPVVFLHDNVSRDIILEAYKGHSIDFDISRPIDFEVFAEQINALARRATIERAAVETMYTIGKYKIDISDRKIILGDSMLKLSEREAAILNYLCMFMNRSIASKDIQKELWGESTYATSASLNNHLVNIRRYLSADPRIKIESKRPGEIGIFFEG